MNHKLEGFLTLIDYGIEIENNIFYIVTDMLGKDIQFLMTKCPLKKFKLETAIKIGVQMFKRIKDFHGIGYIHRDIKLNNYVVNLSPEEISNNNKKGNNSLIMPKKGCEGSGKDLQVHLIDYGICKKITSSETS